ncbi:MAG: P-loop NTPase [Candidatus Aenigmarchaeota archaeon]|nr:P-loop NTPase [Candidatus Aenigmarchaeota archaeon]
MGISIGVASGKGGVGKTTTVLNIGASLHSLGKSVVLVDANLEAADLSLYLGDISYDKTLFDVLCGGSNISDVFISQQHGLKIVPGPLGILEETGLENLKVHIDSLKENHDFVIVDISPGTGKHVRDSIRACDEIIIVTVPQLPAVTDARKIMELASQERVPIKGLVVNAVGRGKNELSSDDIADFCRAEVIGSIPEDREVCSSVDRLTPVIFMNPKSRAAENFAKISSSIASIPYEKRAGFLGRLNEAIRYIISGKI